MTSSVLGIDTQTGQRIEIPKSSRLQGSYIIGIPGTGKTGLIENLIIQDIKQGLGVCVLDPHGDLINAVLARMDRREDDVILLDITDYQHPFGLNLFACSDPTNPMEVQKTVDQVMHIFERLFEVTRTTPLIIQYLRNCTHTLIANPGYTMADIPLLLRNKACRSKLVANVRDRNVVGFWQDYDDMKPSDQRAEREPILRRLEELLQPLTFDIIGQSSTTLDTRQIMDEGKILLVKLSAQLDSVTSLIGSILIALFLNAAYSRVDLPVNKRKQFNLYADEFQRFATEDFAILLTEARKFGIATTIAHQARYQPGMTDGIRATSLSAANLVAFKVNSKDADELAGEFDITPAPERIEEIEKEELIGQKPVRTFKYDIIGHLLRQGHEDERVMDFVRKYLQELHLASFEEINEKREAVDYTGGKHGYVVYRDVVHYPTNHLGIKYDPRAIRAVNMELNQWLYEGMRSSDALWQPLPEFAFSFLASFFGFKAVYEVLGGPYAADGVWSFKYSMVKRDLSLQKLDANGSMNNRASEGAREDALVDFLSTLLPNRSRAEIKAAWQQKAIDLETCSFSELQDRSRFALARITSEIYKNAVLPDLGAIAYTRRFIAELSKPELAIDVFLIALFYAFHKSSFFKVWNESRPQWESFRLPNQESLYLPYHKYDVEVIPYLTYEHPPELHQQGVHLSIMEELPRFLVPFLAYVKFCASLHCAQLALYQRPIWTMDSGEYEQDKRTQTHYIMHSQRPYQDRLNEVASELVNLPLYTARVKMTTATGRVEHTIKTLNPKGQSERPLFGQALQARLKSIRERNIQVGYLRERAVVQEEIRQRQEQYREPPDETPISRRPQR